MLNFVVVGGGPTGVEVAADLADFLNGDAGDLYPELMPYVSIKLANTGEFFAFHLRQGHLGGQREHLPGKGCRRNGRVQSDGGHSRRSDHKEEN